MKIGLKYRIYPNKEQQQLIHQTAGNTRFIYNHFLKMKNDWWARNKDLPIEQREKYLSGIDMVNLLPQLKKTIYSIDRHAQIDGELVDFMNINGSQFESLKTNWLKDGLSTPLQQTVRDLDKAFQDFFKKRKGYPQFKKKQNQQSFTITPHNWQFVYQKNHKIYDKNIHKHNIEKPEIHGPNIKMKFSNTDLFISCCDTPIQIKHSKSRISDFDVSKVSKITISFNPSGQYFITFLVDEEIKDLKWRNIAKVNSEYLKHCDAHGNKNTIKASIDLGIKNTLNIQVNKENIKQSLEMKKIKGLAKHQKRLARAQRSLSRKTKGSNNRNKQRLKVAKIHQDLVNYRTDFYHKATTELVMSCDHMVIEDLAIKNMVKNKKLAKAISQQSWGQFVTMLKYKSVWYGKQLTVVDRFFPSSKLCSNCHTYNDHVKQQDRWTCQHCGSIDHPTVHQRDENACQNLLDYEDYTKVGKNYIHKGINQQNLDHNQVKNKNNKKLKSNEQIHSVGQRLPEHKPCRDVVRPDDSLNQTADVCEAGIPSLQSVGNL